MPFVILEKEFDPPLTEEAHDAEAERLDPCLQVHGVRWIRSYVSTDRRRMICEFEAADAERLRGAMRSAGVPFSRIWAAEEYRSGGGARGSWVRPARRDRDEGRDMGKMAETAEEVCMPAKRKVADCRLFPSEKNCSLTIAGTEEEVMDVAIYHAVKSHGHTDTPEFRNQLREFLKDEE